MKLYVEPGDSSSLKCLAVVAVCDVHMEVIGVRQRGDLVLVVEMPQHVVSLLLKWCVCVVGVEAGNVLPYLERATVRRNDLIFDLCF